MKHNFYQASDIEEGDYTMYNLVVAGKLSICKKCNLSEGSLTTDCPGERVVYETSRQVYDGEADFIASKGWVKQTSKSSPAIWKDYEYKKPSSCN